MPLVILDTPTRRKLPSRVGAVRAVVVHGTGQTDLDKLIAYYSSPDGLQPHYMIETTGTVRQFVADDHVAYHAGLRARELQLYRMGYSTWSRWKWTSGEAPEHLGDEWSGYREWRDQWQPLGLQSPLDLPCGDKTNAATIGVELQSPTEGPFVPEQYAALAGLLRVVESRHGLPLDRSHVVGHSDVSPMRRCNVLGGWDPGRGFNWLRLWYLLR